MPVIYLEVNHNYLCIFTSRAKSAQGDRNDELTKRKALPTCELKFSAKATIQNIEKQVKTLRKNQEKLELKIDELLKLLKPKNGKHVVVNFRQLVVTVTTVQRTDVLIYFIWYRSVASPVNCNTTGTLTQYKS